MNILVGSRYGTSWISSNSNEYVYRLQNSKNLPWYYENYIYINSTIQQAVPCDINLLPISRKQLIDSDRALYRLHLRSVKVWRTHDDFYWNCDIDLTNDYENTWHRIIELGKPPVVLQGKSLI